MHVVCPAASHQGGVIFVGYDLVGGITIQNSTMANNSAQTGSGGKYRGVEFAPVGVLLLYQGQVVTLGDKI
jgi:hypothetical protein